MEAHKSFSYQNSVIRPVRDYLINGPIPAEDLAYLEFIPTHLDKGILESILPVHFMLETISTKGVPEWWKGSVAEFEKEFHDQYQSRICDLKKDSEFVWMAALEEVKAKRLSPLPQNETMEQVEIYLAQGRKRLQQTFAVELLLDMWVEAREMGE